jgi:hypothetical protein
VSWLPALLAAAALVALLATTPAGRRLRARLGVGRGRGDRAPQEDHDFLLRACGGDEAKLTGLLEAELRRNPALSEAQLYRKAIRRWFAQRDSDADPL